MKCAAHPAPRLSLFGFLADILHEQWCAYTADLTITDGKLMFHLLFLPFFSFARPSLPGRSGVICPLSE